MGAGVFEAFQESDQREWMLRCPGGSRWTTLAQEFPKKLGGEVQIIRPRGDGSFYRACPKCTAGFDPESGEWVPEFPDRPVHGYLICQLSSRRMGPGEIVREYRKTRFPERFEASKTVIGGLAYPASKHGRVIYEAA